MISNEFYHIPVLPSETINALNIKKDGIYVDGTLGGAGHGVKIIEKGGRLIGIDCDIAAIKAAESKLYGNFSLVHDNFHNIKKILKSLIINKIDGALLDLGVSSYQIDTPKRGFSYRFNGPLDMRMNTSSAMTAEKIVNEFNESEIIKILSLS